MQASLPIKITYRNIEPVESVEADLRRRAANLEKFCPTLISVRILIETPHRRHQKGSLHRVRIEMSVPGTELVVSRHRDDQAHSDAKVAIRDAFKAARRELEDYVRVRRHQVKHHEAAPAATVVRLFAGEGYGFLRTREGRDIYFHENSVDGDFTALAVGTRVRFGEEAGDNGPQATFVRAT